MKKETTFKSYKFKYCTSFKKSINYVYCKILCIVIFLGSFWIFFGIFGSLIGKSDVFNKRAYTGKFHRRKNFLIWWECSIVFSCFLYKLLKFFFFFLYIWFKRSIILSKDHIIEYISYLQSCTWLSVKIWVSNLVNKVSTIVQYLY